MEIYKRALDNPNCQYDIIHKIAKLHNIVVGKHGILTFEVVIFVDVVLLLVLSFDIFVPTSAHPFIF